MLESVINSLLELQISTKSISSVALSDLVDILIITFLIYNVMLWVMETRAWSLLKGFVIILAVNAATYVFNLYTVRWLIENTLSVGLIALIVIFQPELRRVLEQLGRGRFFQSFMGGAQGGDGNFSAKTREAIVRAATTMAKARTGALIVVEQMVTTNEYEQTGIRVDAEASSQLLINIFENKTPLHDGAVIIRRNRIAAAKCILPLSQSDMDKRLGTRHRAALGVSEVTDAIVIVVSEETGGISAAAGGKLNRNLSEDQLRNTLTTEGAEEKKRLILWKGRGAND